jgi:hypothetical protein
LVEQFSFFSLPLKHFSCVLKVSRNNQAQQSNNHYLKIKNTINNPRSHNKTKSFPKFIK